MATSGRNHGIDALKLIASALVIGIHTGFLKETSPLLSHVFVNGLFRLAVAVFFVASGFFFFRSATPERVGGWLKRVFCLYVLWTAVYAAWWWPSIKTVLTGYWHLWYLLALLGAGALQYALRSLSTRRLLCLAAGLFVVGVAIQYAGSYHLLAIAEKKYLFRNALFFGLPLFSVGYLLARNSIELRAGRLFTFGIAVLALEGFLSFRTHETFDLLLGQALAAPAIFLLATRWQPRLAVPAELSTAVYFLHPLGILALYRAGMKDGTLLTFAVLALAILAGSALVWANRRFLGRNFL